MEAKRGKKKASVLCLLCKAGDRRIRWTRFTGKSSFRKRPKASRNPYIFSDNEGSKTLKEIGEDLNRMESEAVTKHYSKLDGPESDQLNQKLSKDSVDWVYGESV